ncbi:GNAT family N-acetyltransferase [Thalassiella azotivora]
MPTTPPHLAKPELTYATEEGWPQYAAAILRGFQEESPEHTLEAERKVVEWDRSFGHQVDGRWVSTCGAFSRRMTVPGGASVPAAAVTIVTVHPPYRRRGLLTEMMTHQLEDVRRRGEPVATLWASESLIYGRFGYGHAAPRARISGRTRNLAYLPDVDLGDGSVAEVEQEEYLDVVRDLHARLLPQRVGALDRPGPWWERTLFDPSEWRDGATAARYVLHFDADGTPTGFARYRFKEGYDPSGVPEGEVRVADVDAATPQGYARLWRYLLDLDLARKFIQRNAPADDVLRHLVADHRAVHTELTDGIYVRLVDVAAALGARRYSSDVDVVLGVRDRLLPHNDARFRLRGGPTSADVQRTDDAADLELDVRELGTVYLGGPTLCELARAGRVTERTPGALAAASAAFAGQRAPFCPDMF